jgi:preprotein translocase subunit SecE
MKIVNYVKECYSELIHKVSWPTSKELGSSTIVVMVASLIMAVIVFIIDYAFEGGMSLFYKAILN